MPERIAGAIEPSDPRTPSADRLLARNGERRELRHQRWPMGHAEDERAERGLEPRSGSRNSVSTQRMKGRPAAEGPSPRPPARGNSIPRTTLISPPDAASEHEADVVADRIAGRRRVLHWQQRGPNVLPGSGPGAGSPLDTRVSDRYSHALGVDLSGVRIHADYAASAAADRLGAPAYTIGSHIVFGRGRFDPSSCRGSWLLAHELVHVRSAAERGTAFELARGPEDVPALDQKLYDGVKVAGGEGYKRAAEALNAFADFDIKARISPNPGAGRPRLTRIQVASIHLAAIDHPGLGPNSNVAIFTRPAYLDQNFENEKKKGNWQAAARYMNGFSDPDMDVRLKRLSLDELKALQLGALQDPQVGPGSALAKNVVAAIKTARLAVATSLMASGDLDPPETKSGTSQPGSWTALSIGGGNPNVGVPVGDRETLGGETDWSKDPSYVDQGITGASYDILTGLFQIRYAGGSFLNLDLDQVKAGAAAGSAGLLVYFRNKKNGRIYPTSFAKSTIPTITACALEILRLEPEARARTLGTLIDLAVAAHGVARATLSVNQAAAGQPSGSKPSKKSGSGGGDARQGSSGKVSSSPKQATEPSPAPSPAGGSTGGGSTGGGKGGVSAAPSGKGTSGASTAKGTSGGLQEVGTGGAKPSVAPPENLPPEAFRPSPGSPGAAFGAGFKYLVGQGKATVAGTQLGEGMLIAAESGATVLGATTKVAEGPVVVGAAGLINAIVVAGGKFVAKGGGGGRPVAYALVLADTVYLILSSAPEPKEPAKAPGKETGPVAVPGKDATTVKAPAADKSPVPATEPTKQVAVEEPGPLVDEPAQCAKMNGSKVKHDHHVFPQKFRRLFKDLDIEIDDWTITMRWDEHVGSKGVHVSFGWNDLWDEFFDDMPEVARMTKEQALGWQKRAKNFAFRLMVEAGIDTRTLHKWGK